MRRRHARLAPPDLTSLFDVLFIVVFAALIRAASAEQAQAAPPPTPPAPAAPVPPADVTALHDRAVAQLSARTPLVARISRDGVLTAIEVDGRRVPVDVALTQHVADPDVALAYVGDVCQLAAQRTGVDLSTYLVILAPEAPLSDLPHALYDGLRHDAERCVAVVVAP